MSHSLARKIQPFTIGTRLSSPAPKCSTDGLDEQVCVWTPEEHHLHHHQKEPSELQRLPDATASRSIRKITICSRLKDQLETTRPAENILSNLNNNNNSISIASADTHLESQQADEEISSNLQDGKSLVKDREEAGQSFPSVTKNQKNSAGQLNQLHDQWGNLKPAAVNQSKVVGGAMSLQEFHTKVDHLEAWIKHKEQEQSLANILGENLDKMQLTKKILYLKQDEQQFHSLHEEINHMTLKLEKQEKAEGKSVASRRKHINKLWLKTQSQLKQYHENLQRGLEVSAFFQQADQVISSIHNMCEDSYQGAVGNSRDGEMRDMASQILMLDVAVSQLSILQPELMTRVTEKLSEAKDGWTRLQNTFRSEKASQQQSDPRVRSPGTIGSVGTEPHTVLGNDVRKEEKDRREFKSVSSVSDVAEDEGGSDSTCLDLQMEAECGTAVVQQQLQKFSVSADKMLLWLKDSVAGAAQICILSGPGALENAQKRQASLEQELLTHRARIQRVKEEGLGLVRAQHSGSTRIQEFLAQMEDLWDELKKRLERNAVVLKLSEELNYRAVRVLQALCGLEAWLEGVELSVTQAALAGDPRSVSAAEQECGRLERELEVRGQELKTLREEVQHLSSHAHVHTRMLPARLQGLERKFSRVQAALSQQNVLLRDTRMLTDFLKKVELEESHCHSLTQCGQREPAEKPPMTITKPVKELREAVEMLNDTALERGRSQSHEDIIHQLLSMHVLLSERMEKSRQRCADLAADVLEMEREMAVHCELNGCGLEELQEQHDQLEAELVLVNEEMDVLEIRASGMWNVCPEKMASVRTQVESGRRGREELEKSLSENRRRLQESEHLRCFFRTYLEMISWTENTRSCIFSDHTLQNLDGLDQQIQLKFWEFEQLLLKSGTLSENQHHLRDMISERMEELRCMLGWIQLHWRMQKDQLMVGQKTREEKASNIYSEAQDTLSSQPEAWRSGVRAPPAAPEESLQQSDVYEEMKSQSEHLLLKVTSHQSEGQTNQEPDGTPAQCVQRCHSSPYKIFWKRCQGLFGSLKRKKKIYQHKAEEVCSDRPMTGKIKSVASVYESMSPTRNQGTTQCSSSMSSSPCLPPSSDTYKQASQSPVNPQPKNGNSSFFSSLKRKSHKRKKKDEGVDAIQKILGDQMPEKTRETAIYEPVVYDTHTWPLKERKKQRNAQKPKSDGAQMLDYLRNPLEKDIDSECVKGSGSLGENIMSENTTVRVKNHCRFLSLGSVLSFDLPKDMSLIPNIQDVIIIGQPEQKKPETCDSNPRLTPLSTFKTARAPLTQKPEIQPCSPGETGLSIDSEETAIISTDTMFLDDEFPPPPSPVAEDTLFDEDPVLLDNCSFINTFAISETPRVPLETPLDNINPHDPKPSQNATQPLTKNLSTTAEIYLSSSSQSLTHNPISQFPASSIQSSADSHLPVQNMLSFTTDEQEDSVDSGHSSTGSHELYAESLHHETEESSCTLPNRTVVKQPFLEAIESSEKRLTFREGSIHPDHNQFEQEEEELEDIWNCTNSCRHSVCSDVMYNAYQGLQDLLSSPVQAKQPSPKEQAVFRTLITASAPNLREVEFRLPASFHSLLSSWQNSASLDKGSRRSWAAFSDQEKSYKPVTANETTSGYVKLPQLEEQQKYIYQYQDEDLEDEESVEAKSTTILELECNANDSEIQSASQDLPSLEGMLEKKRKLQIGGKKVSGSMWSSCHVVLHKQTLFFYKDRNYATQGCVSSSPLTLKGATCEASAEHTKKPNSFCLRLRNGSEYLLSAPSQFVMRKWVHHIQEHAETQCGAIERSNRYRIYSGSKVSKEKRRSHSFTSATYQRIQPVAPARDGISSFTVTLRTGPDTPQRTDVCPGSGPVRSYSSLPRLWNKSVLHKFFCKTRDCR